MYVNCPPGCGGCECHHCVEHTCDCGLETCCVCGPAMKEGKALRFNAGKPKFGYLPVWLLHNFAAMVGGWREVQFAALRPLVSTFEFGETKYGRGNWLKGLPLTESYDSLCRHLFLGWFAGERLDAESGCHHLGHAMWNLVSMLVKVEEKPCKRKTTLGFVTPDELSDLLFACLSELSQELAKDTPALSIRACQESQVISRTILVLYHMILEQEVPYDVT